MKEIWKPISGWEGYYEVSDHGRVQSLDRTVPDKRLGKRRLKGRILKPSAGTKDLPYAIVTLQCGGRRGNPKANIVMPYVHDLVLEHFVEPRPDGLEACHKDGNGMNNYVDNLRWDTHHENMLDLAFGRRSPRSKTGYTGVYQLNGKYRAVIICKGKHHYLGLFESAKSAADAREAAYPDITGRVY